jgi:hypothetical protein
MVGGLPALLQLESTPLQAHGRDSLLFLAHLILVVTARSTCRFSRAWVGSVGHLAGAANSTSGTQNQMFPFCTHTTTFLSAILTDVYQQLKQNG